MISELFCLRKNNRLSCYIYDRGDCIIFIYVALCIYGSGKGPEQCTLQPSISVSKSPERRSLMSSVECVPSVLTGLLDEPGCFADIYNDGGGYSDGYGDAGYGDYGDSAGDPDPTDS